MGINEGNQRIPKANNNSRKLTTRSKHISTVCRKAGQRLGGSSEALQKVANKLDVKGKATVYKVRVRSVMEYACLSWMNASDSVLAQLDSIQRKALRIIGVDEAEAARNLAITSLHHRRQVAATTVLYKMHTRHSPADLRVFLPSLYERRRCTRSSTSMPTHVLPCLLQRPPPLTEASFIQPSGSGTTFLMQLLEPSLATNFKHSKATAT